MSRPVFPSFWYARKNIATIRRAEYVQVGMEKNGFSLEGEQLPPRHSNGGVWVRKPCPKGRSGEAGSRRNAVKWSIRTTSSPTRANLREGGQSATGCATDNDGRIPFPFENSVIADHWWTGLRDTGTPARSAPHSFAGPFGGRATNPFDGPLRITR
ncbi:hypothetical protein ACIRA2_03430 [Streptomyces griseoviridis]